MQTVIHKRPSSSTAKRSAKIPQGTYYDLALISILSVAHLETARCHRVANCEIECVPSRPAIW